MGEKKLKKKERGQNPQQHSELKQGKILEQNKERKAPSREKHLKRPWQTKKKRWWHGEGVKSRRKGTDLLQSKAHEKGTARIKKAGFLGGNAKK